LRFSSYIGARRATAQPHLLRVVNGTASFLRDQHEMRLHLVCWCVRDVRGQRTAVVDQVAGRAVRAVRASFAFYGGVNDNAAPGRRIVRLLARGRD
jgi:hypothetical protein